MADYVENYQTSVDTQSGQSWQKMQENLTNTFSNLQNANITRIKENKEEAIKQAKIIQDRNIKSQADTLEYTTDLQSKFSKMDPIEFHKTFDNVIKTRANFKTRMDAGEILSPEDRVLYTNAMNAPTIVKNALANQLSVLQSTKEAMAKPTNTPGAYSILNNGSATNKFTTANTPVKGGANIQQAYILNSNFTGVDVNVNVGGKTVSSLSGANLEGATSEHGSGGIYTVVDQAGYIDAAKNSSGIYHDEASLKSGEAKGLVGSVKKEFLTTEGRRVYDKDKSGDYHIVYDLNEKGQKAIDDQVDQKIASMSTADLLSYGADFLYMSTSGPEKTAHPIDKEGKDIEVKWINPEWLGQSGNRDDLVARIRKDMIGKIPTEQPEMDELSTTVKIYQSVNKNKTKLTPYQKEMKKYNADMQVFLKASPRNTAEQFKKLYPAPTP